jgi:hypothetical protein
MDEQLSSALFEHMNSPGSGFNMDTLPETFMGTYAYFIDLRPAPISRLLAGLTDLDPVCVFWRLSSLADHFHYFASCHICTMG